MCRRQPAVLRVLLATAWVAAWLALPSSIGATHRGESIADEVTMQLSLQAATMRGVSDQLVAQLHVDDGSPVAGVEVEFVREADFLGPRLVTLGNATTDAYGTARIPINTVESNMRVRVLFTGNDQFLPSEVAADISLPVEPSSPGAGEDEAAVAGLATVAGLMPPLLAVIALAMWVFLLGLSAVTVLTIRRGRPSITVGKERRT